jgi:PiT family inorganic phosphate transporter
MVDALLIAVIVTALFFDFTNGFHDTANAIATAVSTRAMTPRQAVALAAVANLVGAFVTTAVAKTVGQDIINTGLATEQTILAALLGAIAWNLVTWWLGLPSSSSHALIGGLIGAAIVQSGLDGVEWSSILDKVLIPGLLSPVIGFIAAFLLLLAIYWLFFRVPPTAGNRAFRVGQLFSSTWFAFTHGANDAQKTMGVIALALFLNGSIDEFYIPTWVKFAAGIAIATGTYVGGWRIVRTLGQRVFNMDPASGFAAQTAAGTTLYVASIAGFPVSTTQCISGAIMGAGATKRFSAVRWGVAGNIVVAWILTIPATAIVAGALYWPIEALTT